MRRLLSLLCLVVLFVLASPARAAEGGRLGVSSLHSSPSTDPRLPPEYLVDEDPATAWGLLPGAGEGWVELDLGGEALIYGLRIDGFLAADTVLRIEYRSGGSWRSFLLGYLRELPPEGTIDLSYDRAVADGIRLRLVGAGASSSRLAGVAILGIPRKEVLFRLNPKLLGASMSTLPGFPARFLIDGNTRTSWFARGRLLPGHRSGSPEADVFEDGSRCLPWGEGRAEVLLDLGESHLLRSALLYLSSAARGTIVLQAEEGRSYRELGRIEARGGEGWRRIELGGIPARRLRLTVEGREEITGGIGELVLFGTGPYPGGDRRALLHGEETLTGPLNLEFAVADPADGPFRLEFACADSSAAPLALDLNGREFLLGPSLALNGQTLYELQAPQEALFRGANFLRVKPGSGRILTASFLARYNEEGVALPPSGLADRLLLTPAAEAPEIVIPLGREVFLEEAWVFAEDGEGIEAYIGGEGNWTPLGRCGDGLPLRFAGPGSGRTLRIVNPYGDKIDEIVLLGAATTEGPPAVEILHPKDGAVLDLRELGREEVLGFVDDPEARVAINGLPVALEGHFFRLKLTSLHPAPWESLAIEAAARDGQGREGRDRIEVFLGEADLFALDGPEGLVRTTDETHTISGRILRPGVKVAVNGTEVPAARGRFRAVVPLEEGFNRIEVAASFVPPGGKKEFRQTATRMVVRESGEIDIVIDGPADGAYLKDGSVAVTGWVKGPSPLRLTVNGLPVELSPDGSFRSRPIPLAEGENRIAVEARAWDGRMKRLELTVFADRTAPVITLLAPAEGAVLNASSVAVTGRLEEKNPACLLIGGRAAEVANGEFSLVLTLPEGENRISVLARDLAGNTASLSRAVTVDLTPPLPFALSGPAGYTNEDRPEIGFAARDEMSGVAAYYLRADGWEWMGPVTSPYRFAEPLPDGAHVVEVKAVDRAGWETVSAPLQFIVDTVAPGAPAGFDAVSGPGRIALSWEPDSADPAAYYLLRREPAFPEGERTLEGTLRRYVDEGLTDGRSYTYWLRAVDRAGNIGEWTAPQTRLSGYQEAAYDPAGEATLAFDRVKVEIPSGALPEPAVLLALAAPAEMAPLPEEAEGVAPIGEPILLGKLAGDELGDVEFQEPVRLVFTYDGALLPEGTGPYDLRIYYYDEPTGLWLRAGEEEIDPETGTVAVLTTHFSVYQLAANPYAAPSLGAYLEEGPSPSAGFLENHRESVSPESGRVNVQVTDFRFPGRAGMDLVFGRYLDLAPDPMAMSGRHYPGFGRWRPDLPEICNTNGKLQLYLGGGRSVPIPRWEGGYSLLYFETRRDGLPVRIELHRHFDGFTYFLFFRIGEIWTNDYYLVQLADGSRIYLRPDGRFDYMADRTGRNVIRAAYDGDYLKSLRDEATGHAITFAYENKKIKRISCGERVLSFAMEGNTETVTDTLGRTTRYTYAGQPLPFGSAATGLTKIEYPSGARVEYVYEVLTSTVSSRTYQKTVVKERRLVTRDGLVQTTRYQYEFAAYSSYPFDHVVRATVVEGEKTTVWDYIVLAKAGYSTKEEYYADRRILNSARSDGRERIEYTYYFPGELVKSEKHYLGASSTPAYTIEYAYDDWGNLISRKNSASGLEEYFTYANTNATNLPAAIAALPGVEPLPCQSSVTSYIHNLCTGAVSLWRKDGAVLAVREEAKEYAADGSLRRRAEWDETRHEWLTTRYETDVYGNVTALYEPEGKTTRFAYDGNHAYLVEKRIEGVRDADLNPLPPVVTRYGYYPLGEKQYEIDPRGYVTTYKYDLLGRLVEITHPAMDEAPLADPAAYVYAERPGNPKRRYTYRDAQDVTEVVNEEGARSSFRYDGLGHLIRVERFRKGETEPAIVIEFTYDGQFNVVGLKDADGNYTSYGYDPYGRLTRVVLPRDASDSFSGNPTAGVAYDDTAQTRTITDPSSRQRVEYYDPLGRLIRVVLAPGGPEEIEVGYDYDGFGERVLERDPGGGETAYRYDSLGRLVETVLPAVEVWDQAAGRAQRTNPRITYTYDGLSNKTSETNPNGITTFYRHDVLGRLLAVIETYTENGEKKTRTTKTYYDPAGNVLAAVDGSGNTVAYEYHPRGWLKAEVRAHADENDLRRTEYAYDNLGRRISVTDPRGTATSIPGDYTTRFVYDDFGRLIRTIFPDETPGTWEDNPYEETGYDANGNPVWKRDANGNVSRTYYNARNLPYRTADPLGNETRISYGPAGERLEVRDPAGRRTIYAYDGLGRLIRVIDPAGNTTEYTYDKNGNRTGVRDANGNTTRYAYDDLNRLISVTQPAEEGPARMTWYYYDSAGNRVLTVQAPEGVWNGALGDITTTDARIHPTLEYFDELNRLVRSERWAGETVLFTRYTYDAAGNRSSMTDPNGTLVTYDYYRDNLLKAAHYQTPEGVKSVLYTYDPAGNRVRVEDPTCTTTYTVDPQNRVASETKSLGGVSYTVSYRYDAAGNLTGIKYPKSETWVEYAYDAANRLKSVAGFTADEGFAYDPSGIPLAARYANDTTTTYRLDPLGRIELLETVSPSESLLKLVYGYDPVGNIVSIARDAKTGRDYRYNKADELIEEKSHGFTLPTPLPAGVDKTSLGNGQKLIVTLNWDGILVYENLSLVTRLVGYEASGGLVIAERVQELGIGEMPSQVELQVPADSFYSGQAVVTVGLMDGGGNHLALLAGEQVGSGNYIVARGITLTGSIPAGDRAPGNTLGGRLSTMSSTPSGQFVDCNELLYQDNSEKTVASYEEVLIKSFRFTKRNNDYQKIRLNLEVRGEHYIVALIVHYWSQGHLRVYLDGNLMGEYVGTSVDRFDTFSPVYDISALPDGEHLLEFKLFKTGDSAYFWGLPMYGINRKCEVWLVRKQLTRHTFESPTAALAKPIRGVIVTTSTTDTKQQEALADTTYQISTDGTSWTTVDRSYLGREFPLEGGPRRIMLRMSNMKYPYSGSSFYHLQAVPAAEAPPLTPENEWITGYTYDEAGNRKTETEGGTVTAYEYYPHSDRLWKKGGISFTYDSNGNLIEKDTPDGRWNYLYDYANRLTAVYKDGVLRKRYLYDHAGLRIGSVDAEGATTIYLYDLAGNLIQERKGGEVRNYIWALGKHLARVDGIIGDPAAQVYWYHTDHLGTVQVISDASGQVVWRNEYRSFGEQMGPEVEEIENAHAFTGKDWDEEVGLYYFNARWYDPELGRFISEDPVGDPNNPNLYVYARNNPFTFFDPTGLTSLTDIGLTPTTTGATWEELESTEIDESSTSASTEEEVPPSPGEVQSINSQSQSYEDLNPLKYLRELGITGVKIKLPNITDNDRQNLMDLPYVIVEMDKKGTYIKVYDSFKDYILSKQPQFIIEPSGRVTSNSKVINGELLSYACSIYIKENNITYIEWKELVKTRGMWDFKDKNNPLHDKQFTWKGKKYTSYEYGNICYGYTGFYIGIPEPILYLGSLYVHTFRSGKIRSPLGDLEDWPLIHLGTKGTNLPWQLSH